MPDRVTIAETQLQPLKGDFPDVPTYPHVDTALLYQGDVDPFHVTLPIAESGRVSDNGLDYDEELVSAIAEQMSAGIGGIRGHIPDAEISTANPPDDVLWIGHLMVDNTLWAKGYVPPGVTREDIRRKKAVGGNIATSIFGDAIKELHQTGGKKTWKARQFVLEQIDLAPTKRAALKNKHGFVITREMEGEKMPDVREITSAADVPQPIREQIIRESEVAVKAARVAEVEQENAGLKTQIAELATYKQICAEISTTLGPNVDAVPMIVMYHDMATKLAEMMGVPFATIDIKIREMHEQLESLQAEAFDAAVDTTVGELTNWSPKTDAGKSQVAAFRKNFKRAVLGELGSDKKSEKLAEIAKKLWDDEFGTLAETVVAALSGPAAIVPGKDKPAGFTPGFKPTDEQLSEYARKYAKN